MKRIFTLAALAAVIMAVNTASAHSYVAQINSIKTSLQTSESAIREIGCNMSNPDAPDVTTCSIANAAGLAEKILDTLSPSASDRDAARVIALASSAANLATNDVVTKAVFAELKTRPADADALSAAATDLMHIDGQMLLLLGELPRG